MKLLKPLLPWLLVVVGLAILMMASKKMTRGREEAALAVAPAETAPWSLVSVKGSAGPLERTWNCLGRLESISVVTVAGQFPGTLLVVGPREGTRVSEGQVLARIDTEEFDRGVAAKQALMEAARTEATRQQAELQREQSLLQSGGSTASKVEERQSAADAAARKVTALEQELQALAVRRAYAVVLSPVDGVVRERLVEPGELCAAFHSLFRIEGDGHARLSLLLPQEIMRSVQVGDAVRMKDGGESLQAAITRIHPQLDGHAMGTAEADLMALPPSMPAGTRVPISLVLGQQEAAFRIPREALFTRSGHDYLLLIQADTHQKDDTHTKGAVANEVSYHARPCPVSVTFTGDDLLGVTSLDTEITLTAGDLVAIGHPSELRRVRTADAILPRLREEL